MKHTSRLVPPVLAALLIAALAACGPGPNPPAQLGALDPLEVNLSAKTGKTATSSFSFTNTGGSSLAYTTTVPTDAPWLKITDGTAATVQPNQSQTVTLEGTCPAAPGALSTAVTVQGVGDASSLSANVKVTLTCTAPPPAPPSPPTPPVPPSPPAPPTPPTPPPPSPPPAPDTTPDAFSFTAQNDVLPGAEVTSDEITVSGINAPSPITLSTSPKPTLIVNGQVSTATTVSNGDKLALHLTSSDTPGTAVSATLKIGGVEGSFTITTRTPDTSPDPFSFIAQKNVPPNTAVTSNEITVTGINAPTTLAFDGNTTNTQPTLLVNGKVSFGDPVKNGDKIALRLTSSGTPGATVSATLILDIIGSRGGGVRGSFSVTTINPPTLSGYTNIVATQNGPISLRPTVTGGTAPFLFSISPSLPVSLSLDPATGAISGPPNNPQATTSFEVTVTDASGSVARASFNLTVNPQTRFQTGYPDIVARFSVNVVTQGVPVVSGGTAPLTFKIAPDLTANTGLKFDASTGKISGAPTKLSPKTRYQVAVIDANGRGDITEFNLEVRPLVTAVFISPNTATISVGQVLPLSPAIRTDGPGRPGVTWTSSDPCRARVDANGSVTGVSGGSFTVTITATSKDDPTVKAFAAITVVGPQTVPIGSGC